MQTKLSKTDSSESRILWKLYLKIQTQVNKNSGKEHREGGFHN